MKYYIIAGEASGDLHGSNLMKAIKKEDPNATFRFWGGDLMQEVGGTMVKHVKDLAIMGFVEVIKHLGTIRKNLQLAKTDTLDYQPDRLIFIDFPGFNLRIADFAKQHGYTTHFYISPQLWAWKEGRIKGIRKYIDKMYVILPFEKDFYEIKHGYPVHYVGHPLLDVISDRKPVALQVFQETHQLEAKPIIALLPGSRKQEIAAMLEVMLQMVPKFPDYQFVLAGAPSQEKSFYDGIIKGRPVGFVANKTYDLLSVAAAALVTSGTATLETALFKVPEVVCYKGSWISYQIGKRLVNLEYISLVNLIMDQEVVTELIQNEFNPERLEKELQAILEGPKRSQIFEDYHDLELKLGGKGASAKVAKLIVETE